MLAMSTLLRTEGRSHTTCNEKSALTSLYCWSCAFLSARPPKTSKAMVRPRVAGLAGLAMTVSPQIPPTRADFIARDSSEPDPSVSSGDCYYAPGKQADSDYIPCGNTAFGIFSCCAPGSICMDHNACYLSRKLLRAGTGAALTRSQRILTLLAAPIQLTRIHYAQTRGHMLVSCVGIATAFR